VRAVRSRRRTSSAQFLAVAISQDSKDARERGDHAPGFAPEKMIAGLHLHVQLHDGPHFHRASTSKIGQPFESCAACSRLRASIKV
jgi:hypothetical protein